MFHRNPHTLKNKSLPILLGLLILSSCMNVNLTSQRLRFPHSEARKIFIKARTIAEDEVYLVNMVDELKNQLSLRGWETDSYAYQVKSAKDNPLEIERQVLDFKPDLILELYLSDQLASTEYMPANYYSNTVGSGGSYRKTASSNMELNLVDSSEEIPIWQADMSIKLSNEYFRPQLKVGGEVRRAVMEIIQAMEKDGVLYKLSPEN